MTELLNIFELPFEVQGIATYLNKKIVTVDSLGKHIDIEFRQPVVAYLRAEPKDTPKDNGFLECGVRDYLIESKMHLIVIDNGFKYTLDSLLDVLTNQLNSSKDIVITERTKDFNQIKTDENLTEIKDGQMVKISFNYTYEFINECDGLVCNC